MPRIGDLLDWLLAPFRDPLPSSGETRPTRYVIRGGVSSPLQLCVGDRRRSDAASLAEAVDLLLWDVYDRVFRQARRGLVLHAALASRHGRGVLMPGLPDAGKTTLVAGLVRSGFGYLSDEAAVFDPPSGRLLAFPRPLGMEVSSLSLFPGLEERLPREFRRTDRMTRHIPATAIRRGSIARSCTLRFVVVPDYRPGSATQLEPLSRAETLVLLSRSAFAPDRFAREGLEPMGRRLAKAGCYRLQMDDLDDAVRAVVSLFAGRGVGVRTRGQPLR